MRETKQEVRSEKRQRECNTVKNICNQCPVQVSTFFFCWIELKPDGSGEAALVKVEIERLARRSSSAYAPSSYNALDQHGFQPTKLGNN